MVYVQRLKLDVLKPHHPNALEFATALADLGRETEISLTVEAVDEKTESVVVEIDGKDINFDVISERIRELGGSVHSIDEVKVVGTESEPGDAG